MYIKATISVLGAPHPARLRAEAAASSQSVQQGDPAAPASDLWVYFVILWLCNPLYREKVENELGVLRESAVIYIRPLFRNL